MMERKVSKIMSTGTGFGLLLMAAGLIISFFGGEAALIYLGVASMIATSILSLVYFIVYFFYTNEKKYAFFCAAIILFLACVTAFKVLK